MYGDQRKVLWRSVRFDMPTLEVTKCGVLEGDCQNTRQKSNMEMYRLTAFEMPFMARKRLCLEIGGQGVVAIARQGLSQSLRSVIWFC